MLKKVAILILLLLCLPTAFVLVGCALFMPDTSQSEQDDDYMVYFEELEARIEQLKQDVRERDAMITQAGDIIKQYQDENALLRNQLEDCTRQLPEPEDALDVGQFVEPTNPMVRNKAITIVEDAPKGIDANSEAWKIWQINYWVAHNIEYISDPQGQEYFAYARETLESGGGDCDDIAILLASLYEAVRIDSMIAEIDTDGNDIADHMACLVYYSDDADSFLEEENDILNSLQLVSPTGRLYVMGYPAEGLSFLKDYEIGMWIYADPLMEEVKGMVGYIEHEPYKATSVKDVGG